MMNTARNRVWGSEMAVVKAWLSWLRRALIRTQYRVVGGWGEGADSGRLLLGEPMEPERLSSSESRDVVKNKNDREICDKL